MSQRVAVAAEDSVRIDPEGNEISALLALADLQGERVLEIGSGDGRLTWRYAHLPARILAIEPYAPHAARAAAELPAEWRDRVELRAAGFEAIGPSLASASFDTAILSWSLC